MRPISITGAFLATRLVSAADNCFWRSGNQIHAMEFAEWFSCNNTQVQAGGAQLCCLGGSQCGQDSICIKGAGYFVGGCTDGSYGIPVCRTWCTEDLQTWIQYNGNTNAWECCGNNACDGSPPTETFSAIARASWSPIKTAAQSGLASTETSSTSSFRSSANTTSASAAPVRTNNGNQKKSNENSGSSLSSGAKIGIGVACGLIVLAAILGVALFLLRRYKKRQARKAQAYTVETKQEPDFPSAQIAPSTSQKILMLGELDDREAREFMSSPQQQLMSHPQMELPADATARAELEGGFGHAAK